jgi:hypothetical protein
MLQLWKKLRNHGTVMLCKFIQNFQFLWVTNEPLRPNSCFIYNNKSTKVYHILPKDTGTETAKILRTKEIRGYTKLHAIYNVFTLIVC